MALSSLALSMALCAEGSVEAGLPEGVPGGTAVEERHRGAESIVVVERGDIIIGVGLRVDVAAPGCIVR